MSQQLPDPPTESRDEGGAASQAVDTGRQVAHDVADSGRDAAREVVEDAKQQSQHLLDDARERARSQAEDQTHRASEFTRELAGELRSMVDGGGEVNGHLASLAQQGATRLELVSDRLDERGLDGAIDEVRAFARRRPGMFLAGCFGAGLVIGRLVHNTDRDSLTNAMSGGDGESTGRSDDQPASSPELAAPSSAVPVGATGDAPADLSAAGTPSGGASW